MKIALIGYGKMGKAIEELAPGRGHELVMRIDRENRQEFTRENLSKADVAIEFTGPQGAYENIIQCLEWGIPVISGSTGWLERLDEVKELCRKKNGAFLYASNFSIGVNIFFELNKKLASLMATHPEYQPSLEEIHHTRKKDSPSGTAITLAEQVMENLVTKKKWVNHKDAGAEEMTIISKRIGDIPGSHTVKYASDADDIRISHIAHDRSGFALGAILAAEFIKGKKGIFNMQDVLGL
jgi:4-hydroxy-tetrahydrodipicolinate reductase